MINIENIKEEVKNNLKSLQILKIIIFGSYAYGEPTKDSDLDICVIDNSNEKKIVKKRKIRKLLKNMHIAKDILTPSLEEYNYYKNKVGSVYKEIEERGIVL